MKNWTKCKANEQKKIRKESKNFSTLEKKWVDKVRAVYEKVEKAGLQWPGKYPAKFGSALSQFARGLFKYHRWGDI